MNATRNAKRQIVLTLESHEEASTMWHQLNMPPRNCADGIPYVEESFLYVADFDPDCDTYDMWGALDAVMRDIYEEAE